MWISKLLFLAIKGIDILFRSMIQMSKVYIIFPNSKTFLQKKIKKVRCTFVVYVNGL